MSTFHEEMAKVALELIEENGRTVKLVKESSDPSDSDRPWEGSDPEDDTEVEVTAAFAPPSETEDADLLRQVSDVALVSGDEQGSHDFRTFDALLDGTTLRKIVRVRRHQPGDTPILFELFLEGA